MYRLPNKNLFRQKWLNSCSAIADGQCPRQDHFMGQNSTPKDINQKYANDIWNLVNANMVKNANSLTVNTNSEWLTNTQNSRQFHAKLSTNQVRLRRLVSTFHKVNQFFYYRKISFSVHLRFRRRYESRGSNPMPLLDEKWDCISDYISVKYIYFWWHNNIAYIFKWAAISSTRILNLQTLLKIFNLTWSVCQSKYFYFSILSPRYFNDRSARQ